MNVLPPQLSHSPEILALSRTLGTLPHCSGRSDVFSSLTWGWLPLGGLITQRFDSLKKVAHIGSPLLVVHGEQDQLIKPELGRQLFDAAVMPKAFVLVPGGSHHNANSVGQGQYRAALAHLFQLHGSAAIQ